MFETDSQFAVLGLQAGTTNIQVALLIASLLNLIYCPSPGEIPDPPPDDPYNYQLAKTRAVRIYLPIGHFLVAIILYILYSNYVNSQVKGVLNLVSLIVYASVVYEAAVLCSCFTQDNINQSPALYGWLLFEVLLFAGIWSSNVLFLLLRSCKR